MRIAYIIGGLGRIRTDTDLTITRLSFVRVYLISPQAQYEDLTPPCSVAMLSSVSHYQLMTTPGND